jgi:hypothetical protein
MINGFKLIKDPKPIKDDIPVPLITLDELLKTSNLMEPKSKKFFIQNSSDREKTFYNLLNKNPKNNINDNNYNNNKESYNSNKNDFLKPTEKIKM